MNRSDLKTKLQDLAKKHSEIDEDWEGDEFKADERYKLYLDTLIQSHEDVLDLMWTFTSSFWPTEFLNKQAYKKRTQEDLDSGVLYDVEL